MRRATCCCRSSPPDPRRTAARMDYRLAHRREDRLGARKGFVRAADHEGKRTPVRRRNTTGHRRIDHLIARRCRRSDHLARGIDVDGRAVEQQRASRAHGRSRPRYRPYRRSCRWAASRRRHPRRRRPRGHWKTARSHCPCALCQRRFGKIERMDLMPRLDQIGSHAAAHVAKANECDFHSGLHCSLAGKGAKIVSIVVSEMSSAQAGFQRGALSLSTITARTPSTKSG
jgi:hypothetical protein